MDSGIYKILNKITYDFYIGSAASFYFRKSSHWSYLKDNKHFNPHLQRSVNKHGLENFDFIVVEECDKNKLIEREQYYIDTLKPIYNIRTIANSNIGIKFSKEHNEKLSKSLTGKIRTQEQKEHQRQIKLGKTHTQETKDKVSKIVNQLKGNRVGDKINREQIFKVINLLNNNTMNKSIKHICKDNNLNYKSVLRFVNNQTWKEFFPLLNNK